MRLASLETPPQMPIARLSAIMGHINITHRDSCQHKSLAPPIAGGDMITMVQTFAERLRLARRAKKISQAALAGLCGWESQSRISQYESGKRTPKPEEIEALAGKLGTSASWLLFGVEVAEPRASYGVGPGPATRGLVPLISWVRAGALCDAEDTLRPGDAEAWLPCPVPFGEGAFALRVTGASMEPEYRDGEAIYVDPTRAAKHGDDVIVRTPDGLVTFKRFQDTPDGRYLLALNPDHPERIIRVPEGTVVCGVVIGSWMDRRK